MYPQIGGNVSCQLPMIQNCGNKLQNLYGMGFLDATSLQPVAMVFALSHVQGQQIEVLVFQDEANTRGAFAEQEASKAQMTRSSALHHLCMQAVWRSS